MKLIRDEDRKVYAENAQWSYEYPPLYSQMGCRTKWLPLLKKIRETGLSKVANAESIDTASIRPLLILSNTAGKIVQDNNSSRDE